MNHYIAAQHSERIKLAKEWLNCHTTKQNKKNETPKEQDEQDQN